ncbi:agmatine deiminase family protein [Streptomyces sp. NRRL WC-3742]|uniref:agmatine deiminase family protein n=1 Tax=Streptomyces sp. NRRL WC-3742 TaxID=1463934 RepID=UPI00131AE4D4|nr:agmatine deiminase family protein [Streptomyces sp. NRRL WC-3742]
MAAGPDPTSGGSTWVDGPRLERPGGTLMAGERPSRASAAPAGNARTAQARHPESHGNDPLPTDVAVVPGEFEPVDKTLVAWLVDDQESSADQKTYFTELVRAASANSRAVVVGGSREAVDDARTRLGAAGVDTSGIDFVDAKLNTWWIRDYGPIAARTTGGGKRFIHTKYYDDRPNDDAFAARAADLWKVPLSRTDLESEGGNFLSDGAGGCLVTTAILDRPLNVENHVTAADVRDRFGSLYGCRRTTILDPIKGEGTGHVDMFAAFTGNKDVLVGKYDPAYDPENAQVLDADADRLSAAGYRVRRIPMPRHDDGVFRSYTNSLAVNRSVLVPVYSDDTENEKAALDAYRAAFPDRTIVTIDATAIITTGGAIHCTTMTFAAR